MTFTDTTVEAMGTKTLMTLWPHSHPVIPHVTTGTEWSILETEDTHTVLIKHCGEGNTRGEMQFTVKIYCEN